MYTYLHAYKHNEFFVNVCIHVHIIKTYNIEKNVIYTNMKNCRAALVYIYIYIYVYIYMCIHMCSIHEKLQRSCIYVHLNKYIYTYTLQKLSVTQTCKIVALLLNTCTYIYIYIHIHININIHTYIHLCSTYDAPSWSSSMYTYIQSSTYKIIEMFSYNCAYTYIYIHIYIHICVYICAVSMTNFCEPVYMYPHIRT